MKLSISVAIFLAFFAGVDIALLKLLHFNGTFSPFVLKLFMMLGPVVIQLIFYFLAEVFSFLETESTSASEGRYLAQRVMLFSVLKLISSITLWWSAESPYGNTLYLAVLSNFVILLITEIVFLKKV